MANNIRAENDPQILSGIREFLKVRIIVVENH